MTHLGADAALTSIDLRVLSSKNLCSHLVTSASSEIIFSSYSRITFFNSSKSAFLSLVVAFLCPPVCWFRFKVSISFSKWVLTLFSIWSLLSLERCKLDKAFCRWTARSSYVCFLRHCMTRQTQNKYQLARELTPIAVYLSLQFDDIVLSAHQSAV